MSSENAPWFQNTQGVWVTEESDFGRQKPICPGCGKDLGLFITPAWVPEKGHDGDIKLWTRIHPCGAQLKVFND